jgi:PH (Pleckstrin Homology) domain-containing protein
VSALRFVSPERRWRAALMVVPAAWLGWRVGVYAGAAAGAVVGAGLLSFALPIMRTCLIVTAEGLIDRRALRTVRVPWPAVTGFRVQHPSGPWGGFCVAAACRDGTEIDLLATRVYTRLPSSDHLDDLQRICWTLQERLATRGGNLPSDP